MVEIKSAATRKKIPLISFKMTDFYIWNSFKLEIYKHKSSKIETDVEFFLQSRRKKHNSKIICNPRTSKGNATDTPLPSISQTTGGVSVNALTFALKTLRQFFA